MPIVVGPNYPIEAMAQIGRQSARAMGQEAARQQIFQEQTQLAQLDQGQQQIDQRDRLARLQVQSARELQELQGQQSNERIQLEYDRRAQEMIQERDMQVGAAARQATNANVSQFLQTATPEGAAAIRAELNRLNQIERGVGTEYTYEQARPLIDEVMNRVDEAMSNPAFTQPPMTAEQRFAQSSVTLPDGTIIAYDDENKPHLMLRYDQSQQRYDLEATSDLRKLAIEQATIETQNPETGSVTRTFDANLYRQIIGASGIAPGESGGMPTTDDPDIDQVEHAIRALGFDPTVQATPEQRAAVQQYLMQTQAAQSAAASVPAQQASTPPQQQAQQVSVQHRTQQGAAAAKMLMAGANMGQVVQEVFSDSAPQAASIVQQAMQNGANAVEAVDMASEILYNQAAGRFPAIRGVAGAVSGLFGTAPLAAQNMLGVAGQITNAGMSGAGQAIESAIDAGGKIRNEAFERLGEAVLQPENKWKFDALASYQRRYGPIDMDNIKTTSELSSLARMLIGVPRNNSEELTGAQRERYQEMYDLLVDWKTLYHASRVAPSSGVGTQTMGELGQRRTYLRERVRGVSEWLRSETDPLTIQRLNFQLAELRAALADAEAGH